MIQSVNNVGDVFAHVTVDIPLALQKFGSLIDHIGGQNPVNNAVFISAVELVQTIGEQSLSLIHISEPTRPY